MLKHKHLLGILVAALVIAAVHVHPEVRRETVASAATCGDGVLEEDETCDDGGAADGDGCSATCTVEEGWTCEDEPSSCSGICGDGVIVWVEACDDGNTDDADGCSSSCAVESGWSCDGTPSECATTCGDTIVAGTEECDDGNSDAGDGCSPICFNDFFAHWDFHELSGTTVSDIQSGYDATASVDDQWTCSDHNGAMSVDGTTSYAFASAPALNIGGNHITVAALVQLAAEGTNTPVITQRTGECGDNSFNFQLYASETALCGGKPIFTIQPDDPGYLETQQFCCFSDPLAAGEWHHLAATYDGSQIVTYVDGVEGATCAGLSGDMEGVSDTVYLGSDNPCGSDGAMRIDEVRLYNYVLDAEAIETVYAQDTVVESCGTCGDAMIDEDVEECDDGDTDAGDGCSDMCAVETGYACIEEPSVCSPVCGDGVIEGAEECDDGGTDAGDGCSATCVVEDGFICDGAEPTSCTQVVCGDGVIQSDDNESVIEECDDGNADDGDGCDSDCAEESGWSCDGEPSVCSEDGGGSTGGSGGSTGGETGGSTGGGGSAAPSQTGGGNTESGGRRGSGAIPPAGSPRQAGGVQSERTHTAPEQPTLTESDVDRFFNRHAVWPPCGDGAAPAPTTSEAQSARRTTRGAVMLRIAERLCLPLRFGTVPFTDVDPWTRIGAAVRALWKQGIVRGYESPADGAKLAGPDDPLMSEHLQLMLDRLKGAGLLRR